MIDTQRQEAHDINGIVKEIGKNHYKILGFDVTIGPDGLINKGPVWLLGRDIQSAVDHAVQRQRGIQESNWDFDRFLINRI